MFPSQSTQCNTGFSGGKIEIEWSFVSLILPFLSPVLVLQWPQYQDWDDFLLNPK
jgi:hypothetical protein